MPGNQDGGGVSRRVFLIRSASGTATVTGVLARSGRAGADSPPGAESGGRIVVGRNVHVSAARPGLWHNEVVIAADPNHPDRLLACSMLIDRGIHSAAYVSFDRGRTWAAAALAAESFANDPTCAYGPDGAAYFIAKTATKEPRRGSDGDAIYLRRSPDGGKTWDPVVKGIPCVDRPFMAVDHTTGRYRGRLYVAFNHRLYGETAGRTPADFRNTIRLAASLDGGKSFPHRVDRLLLGQDEKRIAASMVGATGVLSDGTVVVFHQHAVMTQKNPATGKPRVERAWLQLFRSTDGGETLEPAVKIADVESSYNLENSRGVAGDMAVDAGGGRFRDRLYVVWADVRSGRSEIMLSYSADKGQTWAKPRVVSDGKRSDRPSGGPDDFMPAVAVNKDGVVGVQWYDRRDNPDNQGYYARFSASPDGGETWLPSVRVSEEPNSVPKDRSKAARFNLTGGDTAGLAADAEGAFHALWIDNRTGVQQVWTAPITVERK